MKNKLYLDDILFALIYLLGMTDTVLIGLSTLGALFHPDLLSTLLRAAATALLIVKLLLDRTYKLSTLVTMFGIGLVFLVSLVLSRYNHIFYFLLIFLGIRHVNIYRLMRVDFWAKIILYSVIVLAALTGVSENYVGSRSNGIYRYSMGFSHPNALASLTLMLILSDAWLHKRRFSGLYVGIIWLIALAVYLITVNRTSVLLMILFPFFLIPLSASAAPRPVGKTMTLLSTLAFSLAAVFCVFIMFYCGNSMIARAIDTLLSKRFTNAFVVFRSYGIPLIGQRVELNSVRTAFLNNQALMLLDVAYLRMLIQGGILPVLLMAVMYARLARRLCREGDRYTLMLMLIMIIYGISESIFNNVYINFVFIFAAKNLYADDDTMALPLSGTIHSSSTCLRR